MKSEIEFIERALRNRYSRTSGYVAFIDETYRVNNFEDEENFYLVAGILVHKDLLAERRQAFLRVTHSDYWHTTEAFAGQNQTTIRDFLRLLASTEDLQVFAFTVSVSEKQIENARRICLTQLLKVLEAYEVRTAVIERRKLLSDRRSDEALFKKAIASGLVGRKLEIMQGHPAAECLLWGADLICWALRRYLALNETEWIKIIRESVFLVETDLEPPVKKKKPEPAAAKGSGHESSAVPKDTGHNRSSEKILSPKTDIRQRASIFFKQSLGEVIPSEVLGAWLQEVFPQ